MFRKLFAIGILACGLGSAQASLVGHTVSFGHYIPDMATIVPGGAAGGGNFVVGAGVETQFFSTYTVDVSASQVVFDFADSGATFTSNFAFNGAILGDALGTIGDFVSVTVDPASTFLLPAGALTFGADSIAVNFSGVAFSRTSDLLILNIETAADPADIPEPGSLAIALLALMGVAEASRRSKR